MSNSDFGGSDTAELSDETRRDISEFVERSDHYDSIEEFVEDAAKSQIELLRWTADSARQPVERTNGIVRQLLILGTRSFITVFHELYAIVRKYISSESLNASRSEESRSRTTAAEKMKRYGRSADSDAQLKTYRQRTAEMGELIESQNVSAGEIEREIRDAESE